MAHPLEKKIGAIRHRARVLVLLYALSWLVGTLVCTVAVLGLLDYWLHFQDRGIRAICSLVVLGVGGWAFYYFLLAALRARFDDLLVAQRLERRFPGLKDRLASTVQFLKQDEDDPQAGSAALRREVILQTMADVEPLPLVSVIEPRPVLRTLAAVGVVCLAAWGLYRSDPASAQIALARLANPLGNTHWPKANQLAFVEPVRRVALGQPFDVELRDAKGAELPDVVRIYYRYDGDASATTEMVEMKRVGDVMVARKDSVTRPFSYRAEGGDDATMEWIDLEVVEPPVVEQLSVTLHYPPYTGWPSRVSDPHIKALVETRVQLHGQTTKALRSATLCLEEGRRIPLELTDRGYGFDLPVDAQDPLVVKKSGAYWFELEDPEGFQGGQSDRYEIKALEDQPPTVTLQKPHSDLFVTAEAVVPLEVQAKDDLALHNMELHYSRSDKSDEGDMVLPLYEGLPQMPPLPADAPLTIELGESRLIEYRWDLAPLQLAVGTQVTIFATATDYRPAIGRSQPRRLTIISSDDLQDRLSERQSFILGELARLLKLQQESRGQVGGLQIQLNDVGPLTKQDLDHLQAAELTQRQVTRGLTSPTEGVRAQIAGLLADLDNNKVDGRQMRQRMQTFVDEIDRLGQEHLPAIARELTGALKASQARLDEAAANAPQPQPADQVTAGALDTAVQHQDAVIQSLEQMLGDMSQWDNYRRFHRDIGQLRRDQLELGQETTDLGRQTLTRDIKDLDPQQQADLKKLSQRQFDLARQFDKIQQGMEQMQQQLRQSDPVAADTMSDALHEARQQALGGQMREAGRNIDQNQVGQATKRQIDVAAALQELLDILANRREHELARLVKKLREAESELNAIREKQDGLRKKMSEAAKNPNEEERRRELERLSRQQRQLQQEAERFARTLKRLQADQASRTAARGGAKMGQAGQQGEQGDGQRAAEQAEAAKRDLDEAQQQLARQRRKVETDLALERLARMEDEIVSMVSRQQKLIDETKHYEQLRQEQKRLSRPQSISVRDLARQQQALEQDTQGLSQKLGNAEAFKLALDGAAGQMARAADLLNRQETGDPTQAAEQTALRRLQLLVAALEPGKKEDGSGGGQGGEDQQGSKDQQQGPMHSLAELKLLKLLQEDINLRTEELEDRRRSQQTLTPEQQRQYAALSEEQGRLADALLNLAEPADDKPEDDPDKLPDLAPEKKAPDAPADDPLLPGLPKLKDIP